MKYYKYKMDIGVGNALSFLIAIPLFIIYYLMFPNFYESITYAKMPILLLWFILHEIIHFFGYLINKEVNIKNLYLGVCLEKGIFYCQCSQKVHKKTILISLMSPFTIIGVITLIIAKVFNLPFLGFLSILNMMGAIFDILMAIQIAKMPKDVMFAEFDDPDAYYLISKKDLTKYKTIGLKIAETGDYDSKKIKSKDRKRIEITKKSYIYLIIFVLACLILDYLLKIV